MKKQRKSFFTHKFLERAGWTDEHHLKPRSKGGQTLTSNLLKVDAYRHDAIHLLFGNKSLDEIIAILLRLQRIKKFQRFHKRTC